LTAGTYCDRITGGRVGTSCVGTLVNVGSDGSVVLSLPSNSAIAIDVDTKL
jgi:alpha-amylase